MNRRSIATLVALASALVALTALCAQHRYAVLAESPTPTGIDGYYYALQLRSILEHGTLAYRDFPLAFYLMAPFAALTDPIVGAKLASAILGALAILPTYAIGARLGRSRLVGLIAAVLVGTSAGGSYLAMEFEKNGIGITVALFAIWLGLRATESPAAVETSNVGRKFSRSRIAAAIVAVIAAVLTHKLAGMLVVMIAAPAVLAALADAGTLRGRRLLFTTIGCVAFALLAIMLSGQLRVVTSALSSTPHGTAPALVDDDLVVLSMDYEPLVGLVLGVIAAFVLATKRTALSRPESVAAWAVVALALLIGFPFLDVTDPQGLGMRLRVIAFVPMALCAAIALGACEQPMRRVPALHSLALGVAAVVTFIAMPARRAEGLVVPHPAMVSAVLSMTNRVPAGDTVIVPERQVMFMITWYTRIPTRLTPTEIAPEHRWRAVTAVFVHLGQPLDQALLAARAEPAPPVGLHAMHPNGFVLVPERTWAGVVAHLPEPEHTRVAAWPTI